MDGEDNLVHLLVHYPPKHSVSALVNSLKGVSEPTAATRTTRLCAPLLERRFVVSVVLRCQLRRCAYRYSQDLHRTAEDTPLAVNGGLYPRPEERGFTPPRIRNSFWERPMDNRTLPKLACFLGQG